MSREEVRNHWRKLVEEFRESGETAAAWCREHNLDVKQFRRWARKFDKETSTNATASPRVKLLSVQVEDSVEDAEPALVVHVGAASVEVHNGFNRSLLKQVVQVLAE
ncbi:transposase [Alicyclobacillus sp. SO9]|uniref:IS66 family insertion sequence element accessory protein TnpA n=1 Tax=Alicyclobacillus sp. SO9 TaxID=2665646 RepID=UPI0018E82DD1|nr:transposase [Alicyclobacillus sp. SO9]QQE77835.1 transposase [Alicyclobacillus sp. SO9]QQE78357.1 transposase [Alicyclobacillus sp. SO9]QQE78835.1 transposase [Alicyclobacillus sp. SO9]